MGRNLAQSSEGLDHLGVMDQEEVETRPDLDGGLDGMGTDSKGIWGKLEDSITVIRHSLDFLGPCWEAVGGAAKGEEEQVSVAS